MKLGRLLAHVLLIAFILLMFLPLYLGLVAASHDGQAFLQTPAPYWPGGLLWHNIKTVMTTSLSVTGGEPLWVMLLNSFIMASIIAVCKIILTFNFAFAPGFF